jgi:S-adenosylmethionine:tRNA-ribosyltransferase-isomerase (queuine synthetase)
VWASPKTILLRASFIVLAVAVLLVTGFELPGWLGTTLMVVGAFFGAVGLYSAYRDTGRPR